MSGSAACHVDGFCYFKLRTVTSKDLTDIANLTTHCTVEGCLICDDSSLIACFKFVYKLFCTCHSNNSTVAAECVISQELALYRVIK